MTQFTELVKITVVAGFLIGCETEELADLICSVLASTHIDNHLDKIVVNKLLKDIVKRCGGRVSRSLRS